MKTQQVNRNQEFVKNTVILFIGKFATQFMSLLLLPLYTHYLLAEDYGMVDLFQTYISLFVPILTLRIDSAVFRFLIDKRNNKNESSKIITNIILILLFGLLFTCIVSIILYFILNIKYFILVVTNLLILMISNTLLQILRGIGKNTQYSICSIITGVSTLLFNIIFIVFLKGNGSSILLSSSIANIICIITIIIYAKLFTLINFKHISKPMIKEIVLYSFPMIPNALSWWIVNVSDRTLISIFLGIAFNGIYTVSCKFSNILNSIFSVFNMSWQETASLHINDDDCELFFSNMINQILMFFSNIGLLILAVLPIVYPYVIGSEYSNSYKYIPILIYANTWNVLIGLIGGIYVAKKKTREIANTTIMSAIINIVVNLMLIKYFGLYAACISTLISYISMSLYRYFDCQKYVAFTLDFKALLISTIIFVCCSWCYYSNNLIISFISLFIVIFYSFILNKKYFKAIFIDLQKRFKH